MSKDKNEQVLVALFADRHAAEMASELIKGWDEANDDIKLGAIGTIAKEDGKVKTRVGHKTGRGAGVGAVVGIIAGVLTGGIALIPAAVGGGALGGVIGRFMKQSLHLTKEEIALIGQALDAGRVALVVTCDDYEVEPTRKQLAAAGGTVASFQVPSDAIEQALAGMQEAGIEPEDAPAVAEQEASEGKSGDG